MDIQKTRELTSFQGSPWQWQVIILVLTAVISGGIYLVIYNNADIAVRYALAMMCVLMLFFSPFIFVSKPARALAIVFVLTALPWFFSAIDYLPGLITPLFPVTLAILAFTTISLFITWGIALIFFFVVHLRGKRALTWAMLTFSFLLILVQLSLPVGPYRPDTSFIEILESLIPVKGNF